MLIAINAGHFVGIDPGACGAFSNEAAIVKEIAQIVCNDLEGVGVNAVFISDNDLENICQRANNANANLFISLHCNAAANKMAKGTETYFFNGSASSYRLANNIHAQLIDTMQTMDRGLKDGNWLYVLKNTTMPAALVEIGFISNFEEEQYINDNKTKIAHAISRGITDYLVG